MDSPSVWARNLRNIIVLILLLLAAAVLFALEFLLDVKGPNDEVIFRAVQFFLAISIGWVIQSIASGEELQRSLRQFAISAWRRISDISGSVSRMQQTIRSGSQSGRSADRTVDVIRAIAREMAYTVSSSMDDWADIIGPELEKVRKIHELQQEERMKAMPDTQETLPSGDEADSIEDVRKQIAELRGDLPWLISSATVYDQADTLPREGRHSEVVAAHIRASAAVDNMVSVPVESGIYGGDITTELALDGQIQLHVDQNMFQLYLSVADSNGQAFGMIRNPLDDAGVYGNDFVVTLLDFVPHEPAGMTEEHGQVYSVSGCEVVASTAADDVSFYLRLPVNLEAHG